MCIMNVELLAILEALSYVISLQGDKFVIFSDSKSALQHIAHCTSKARSSPAAYEILNLIQNCNNLSRNVVLQWIPSHVNIVGNTMADQLAKEAMCEGIETSVLPFYTDCLDIIKDERFKLWKEFYDKRSKEKGIWFRTIQAEPFKKPWLQETSMNRKEIVAALRLRSGHIPLNKFAYLMGKAPTPNCDQCNVIEDVFHILMECVRNDSKRQELFTNNKMLYSTGGINICLGKLDSKLFRLLVKFYNDSLK